MNREFGLEVTEISVRFYPQTRVYSVQDDDLQTGVAEKLLLFVDVHELFDEFFERFVFLEMAFQTLYQFIIEFYRLGHMS